MAYERRMSDWSSDGCSSDLFRPAGLHDATSGQHMHKIRFHIIEQPLIMGDEQHCLIRSPHDRIDPRTHGTQRIDVEAAIRLVPYSQLGIKNAHLHHFIALLLTTTSEERRVGKECVRTCRSRGS